MNTFSVEAAFRFGWETFRKRPGFFVGVTLIIGLVSFLTGAVAGMFGAGDGGIIGGAIQFLVSALVDLGVTTLMLKVYDSVESAHFGDLWSPKLYIPYLGVTILVGIAVGIWFVLSYILGPLGMLIAIIPAAIAALTFMFAKFLVVDRKLGPVEAMKESMRITKGRYGSLILFVIAIAVMNFIGALALLVGLLITVPVSGIAVVYVYRTIGHKASEVVPAPAPAATSSI